MGYNNAADSYPLKSERSIMKRKTVFLSLSLAVLAVVATACATAEQKLAAKREKDPQYQYEKAVICMNAGLTDAAIPYLRQALALDPRHHPSLNLLGLAHMIKGQVDSAVAVLKQCVEIAPSFSDGRNNLATALLENGNTEGAEEEYKKAYALDGNFNASFNLAKIEFQRNKPQEALEYVQSSLRKNNRSLLALNLRGLIEEALGRPDEAIASYEAALKIVPEELNVEYNLAVAHYKKGNTDKARTLLQKIQKKLRQRTPPLAGDAELKGRVEELLKLLDGR